MARNFILIIILNLTYIHFTVSQCNFKVIGHKGSCYNYPDNTLYSIEQAFVEGVWAAEVDVRPTVDNVLVLCHEGDINKATSETGYIDELYYSYLKTLDAGSWKDKKFAGINIPTLIDALKLAHKYNKKLYLDMVGWQPNLLLKAINEAGVPQDICFTDPKSLEEIAGYRAILPDMPLVYFGDPPTDINDESFYSYLKNNNVFAAEVYYNNILDSLKRPLYESYRDNLKKHGLELWVFTVNDTTVMRKMQDFGIEGIESDRPAALKNMFCLKGDGGYFPEKRITGQWDFRNKDLSPTIGSKMIEAGNPETERQRLKFNTTEGFGLPAIDGKISDVIYVPPFDSTHSLQFFSNIVPEGNPSPIHDYDYTIIIDFLKPAGSTAPSYISLYQSDDNNLTDATAFIRSSDRGIGIFGQYHGKIDDNQWYRLAMVFDIVNERFDKYINGEYVGTTDLTGKSTGKFALNNNWGGVYALLFSDNDNETDSLYVSSIQIRSYAMDSAEAVLLGKPTADKIPQTIKINAGECPIIIEQPKDVYCSAGDDVSFSIKSQSNVNYLWQVKSVERWFDIKGVNFSDKASPRMLIKNVPAEMHMTSFRCIVSNDCFVGSDAATIYIVPRAKISGRVVYGNSTLTPLPNIEVMLINPEGNIVDTAVTDVSGNYFFNEVGGGEYLLKAAIQKTPGGYNPLDALLVIKHYLGLKEISDALKLQAADVNGDGKINPLDALDINKRYINLTNTFKPGDWQSEPSVVLHKGEDTQKNIRIICTGDVNGSYKP